jgi:hypothetical protein
LSDHGEWFDGNKPTGPIRIMNAGLLIAKLPRAMESSPGFTMFRIVSVVVCGYVLSDTIICYDLE